MATPPPAITSLPLLPLVRIAEGLTDADVRALCAAFPNLQASLEQLLPHALPTEFVEHLFPNPPHYQRFCVDSISRDGMRVAGVASMILWRNEPTPWSAFTGTLDGELQQVTLDSFMGVTDLGIWFTGDASENIVIPADRLVRCNLDDPIIYAVAAHADARELYTVRGHVSAGVTRRNFVPLSGAAAHIERRHGHLILAVRGERRIQFMPDPAGKSPAQYLARHALSPNATRYAVADPSGGMGIWDAATGAFLWHIPPHPDHQPPPRMPDTIAIAFNDTSDVIATSHYNGNVCTWMGSPPQPTHTAKIACGHGANYLVVRGTTVLAACIFHSTSTLLMDAVTGNSYTLSYTMERSTTACTLTQDRTKIIIADNNRVASINIGHLAARLAHPLARPTKLAPAPPQTH